MNLLSFRIRNFRSIVDSGKIPFSPDGITVFVGQNESGKSSILDALFFALSLESPTEDDIRIGDGLPTIEFKVKIEFAYLFEDLSESESFTRPVLAVLEEYFAVQSNMLEITISWAQTTKDGKPAFDRIVTMNSSTLEQELEAAAQVLPNPMFTVTNSNVDSTNVATTPSPLPPKKHFNQNDLADLIWQVLPMGVRFNEDDGALPNSVDINEKGAPTGPGAKAAANFLRIAEIDLARVIKGDVRERNTTMNRANTKVSEDFRRFWSQTIGKSGYLALKCEIQNYPSSHDKSGTAHLVFWISDGNTQLYPAQRSRGTRWFVSFYLQLKASEKEEVIRMFFLDEPGANLHSKAQGDVLRLINKLGKDTATVVYSTHSPQLLEYAKLFRVRAVQRDGDKEDSPTSVIDAHHLGTASSDTLSPVLSAMGVDFSHNRVIKKENNVLLEEMSGFYYITAFWKLTKRNEDVHLIAATGVNKIEALANMFRGWGLGFIVAVDDDKAGREAFKSIKKELYGDDDERAKKNMLKFPNCPSIEDAFSKSDFKKYVLQDEAVDVPATNGDYLKANGRSKPVLAFQFYLRIEQNEVGFEQFEAATRTAITTIVEEITARLPNAV